MNLIDKTYFRNPPCELPLTDESNGYSANLTAQEDARINRYIVIRGKEYLRKALGSDLADLFLAEIAKDEPEEKWVALKNKLVDKDNKISPIANYVFCHYLYENEKTLINRASATTPKAENAIVISNYTNIKQAWDEMTVLNAELFVWLFKNKETYETEEVEMAHNGWFELLEKQSYGF